MFVFECLVFASKSSLEGAIEETSQRQVLLIFEAQMMQRGWIVGSIYPLKSWLEESVARTRLQAARV